MQDEEERIGPDGEWLVEDNDISHRVDVIPGSKIITSKNQSRVNITPHATVPSQYYPYTPGRGTPLDTKRFIGPNEGSLIDIIRESEMVGVNITDPHSLLECFTMPEVISALATVEELTDGSHKPHSKSSLFMHIIGTQTIVNEQAACGLSKEGSSPESVQYTGGVVYYPFGIKQPRDFLELSKAEPHKTNWVLGIAGFGMDDKDVIFKAYGKAIVRKAIELYFKGGNSHVVKALSHQNSVSVMQGLIATMEYLRTNRKNAQLNDLRHIEGDILTEMQRKYQSLGAPNNRIRNTYCLEVSEALNYVVGKYILGRDVQPPMHVLK